MRLGFKLLVQGRAHPKVKELGFGKSLVLGSLNRFPPVNLLLMNPSTRDWKGFDFCRLVSLEIRVSVLGAKVVPNPDTPCIIPDTPEMSSRKLRV